jgi:hypothetical protein
MSFLYLVVSVFAGGATLEELYVLFDAATTSDCNGALSGQGRRNHDASATLEFFDSP